MVPRHILYNRDRRAMNKADTATIRIAPRSDGGYWTVADWKKLTLNNKNKDNWQTAIDIFEARIRRRYFDTIEIIKSYEQSGFAIMSLHCLLIETLQQFFKGVTETPHKEQKTYFKNFFSQTSFAKYFSDPSMGTDFYLWFRNGLLHQAEVKRGSRIWIRSGTPLVRYNHDRTGLEINRDLFHQEMENVFNTYIAALRHNDPADHGLRERFRIKMNSICLMGEA